MLVLIGGGHASGKTTAALWIKKEIENLPEYRPSALDIEVIDMAKYTDETPIVLLGGENAAITVGAKVLLKLKPSRFDFDTLKADIRAKTVEHDGEPLKLIIVHGLYALYDKELSEMSQTKVYIGGDSDSRLIRWIRRDVLSTPPKVGLDSVINYYLHGAKQEMSDFIFPTKERADIIMPKGPEANAVSLIVDGIISILGSTKSAITTNTLRPNAFQNERFDNQKGKYYELN